MKLSANEILSQNHSQSFVKSTSRKEDKDWKSDCQNFSFGLLRATYLTFEGFCRFLNKTPEQTLMIIYDVKEDILRYENLAIKYKFHITLNQHWFDGFPNYWSSWCEQECLKIYSKISVWLLFSSSDFFSFPSLNWWLPV